MQATPRRDAQEDTALIPDTIKRHNTELLDIVDDFARAAKNGRVIGTPSTGGALRQGVDQQSVFSIDNGALRIAPLIEPGWGKASLAYGPFKRANGLSFSVFMLNGHNTAQVENLPEPLTQRLERWLRGSDSYGRAKRLRGWVRAGRYARTWRMFRWWFHLRKSRTTLPLLDENLAIGWFSDSVPKMPVGFGNAFVMHATGPDNGELWANFGARSVPVLSSVPNVPLYYVVVLRERGAVYYAACAIDSDLLPSHPLLRPVGIDVSQSDACVHAVVTQSTIGQIGFRLDSRVYGVRVASIDQWQQWYGAAHAADDLNGIGHMNGSRCATGQSWEVAAGYCERTDSGISASSDFALIIVDAGSESGLLHVMARLLAEDSAIALVWEYQDEQNYRYLSVSQRRCSLIVRECGTDREIKMVEYPNLPLDHPVSVQVALHEGQIIGLVNGETSLACAIAAAKSFHSKVGLRLSGLSNGSIAQYFEAHPLRVSLPPVLDAGSVTVSEGTRVVVREDFEGPARELAGKVTTVGERKWSRLMGRGTIDITGAGSARVRASAEQPNPGRTLFLVDWQSGAGVDLELEMTLPGTDRGQRHRPRVGFVVWQDADNYLLLSVWRGDEYGGGSISAFFQIDGFDDLYDAVWTNIGSRAWYGQKIRLRLLFDGKQFLVLLDDDPVLYRRISDVYPNCRGLLASAVGIVVNWEWGNDTGTELHRFTARGMAS